MEGYGMEEFLKSLGYEKDPCADIPGGFQDLDPITFVIIGEIIGDVLSGQLPFNTANTIANILILVGQIIEAVGTQQQYQEEGPGNIYNIGNKNINNPNCSNLEDTIKKLEKRIEILEGKL